MGELLDTGLKIIGVLLAVLGVGGAVYVRGRQKGRQSVPSKERVRAEVLEEEQLRTRAERRERTREALAELDAEADQRIKHGRATQEDAERLLREAESWPDD